MKSLICRECGREYEPEAVHVCEFCFGPLEINYNYDEIKQAISRESIAAGPLSLWRYRPLLPVMGDEYIDIQAGFSPLIRAKHLGDKLGIKELYIKNDTANPTYSFKDRVVSVALTRAKELGFDTVACASTGNLANSVAAHAAHAGFKAFIFIPADLERGKIISSAIYDPMLVGVRGSYDDVNRLCSEIASEFGWAFVNINIRPYYAEGSKTLAFEVIEQLGWKIPDHYVVPIASGSLLTKVYKGTNEMIKLGLIEDRPFKVSGAQAEGCSPVSQAFKRRTLNVKPVKPDTIAKSLAIGNPADGYYALKVVADTGGFVDDVTDAEIVDGVKLLAQTEGIFTETAGGVTIAVLKKLAESGRIKSDEVTVAYVTGAGMKTLEAVEGSVNLPIPVEPSIESFKERVMAHPVEAS